MKDKGEHDDTFRCLGCIKKINSKQVKKVMLKTNVKEAKKKKSTEEEVPSLKDSPVGKRIKTNIKDVKTITQKGKKDEIKEKKDKYIKNGK